MEGRCLLPSLSPVQGQNPFRLEHLLPARGSEAACWKALHSPALLLSAPLGKPPGRASALAHGHMLGLPFPGSRELPAVLGTPGHGLPEPGLAPRVPGCLPGAWEAAQPAEGGRQSCIQQCQSQLQFEPSKAEPRGPTTGKGAVRGVPAQPPSRCQERMGTPLRDRELGRMCGPL